MTLFHGSSNIIEKPEYGYGNVHNDYGLAFYCTQSIDMAKEWSVTDNKSGYANEYAISIEDLKVMDFTDSKYSILNWLALLIENRVFRMSDIAMQGKEYILENYLPDYKEYDVIKGYRADDSYFSFADGFLNNTLPLEVLDDVMHLGNLGIQYAIRSKKAFDRLEYINSYEADSSVYYPVKKKRDEEARRRFRQEYKNVKTGTFLIDIIRRG